LLTDELSFEVPRDERGPGLSRAAVRDSFRGRISTRELEDLQVIVSELTTNALLYGDGEIHLHALMRDGLVHGHVVDDGHGFERAVDAHGIDALGGNGLNIVSGLARRWGIHEGSSHVWFVLAPDALDG
jgi:anti-sigma regulatory factor (Ser/Thr protein kinase)